jgi:hypothetical protein
MPNASSPIRASPESFSKIRRYLGEPNEAAGLIDVAGGESSGDIERLSLTVFDNHFANSIADYYGEISFTTCRAALHNMHTTRTVHTVHRSGPAKTIFDAARQQTLLWRQPLPLAQRLLLQSLLQVIQHP